MRAIADRVGVTTPVLYLHFSDKQQLMRAVVAEAFADLDQRVRRSTEAAKAPSERLLASGQAYVAFALEKPEHYRLAFMSPPDTARADREPALTVLQWLKPLVDDFLADRLAPQTNSVPLTLGLWTTAHGAASLLTVAPHLQWGDTTAFVRRTLCATLHGSASDAEWTSTGWHSARGSTS